jgi:hypothetical protein
MVCRLKIGNSRAAGASRYEAFAKMHGINIHWIWDGIYADMRATLSAAWDRPRPHRQCGMSVRASVTGDRLSMTETHF